MLRSHVHGRRSGMTRGTAHQESQRWTGLRALAGDDARQRRPARHAARTSSPSPPYWLSLRFETDQLKPWNWAWTVSDRCESSTTESIGSSDVNSSSKLVVSIALACESDGEGSGQQEWPKQRRIGSERRGNARRPA